MKLKTIGQGWINAYYENGLPEMKWKGGKVVE